MLCAQEILNLKQNKNKIKPKMNDKNTQNRFNVLKETNNELPGSQKEDKMDVEEENKKADVNRKPTGNPRNNKRVRLDLDSSAEEDWKDAVLKSDTMIEDIQYAEECIRALCVNDGSKRVSVKLTNDIMAEVEELSKMAMKLLTRNSYLKGIIEGKNAEINALKREMEKRPSTYGDIVKSTSAKTPLITDVPRRARLMTQAIIIKPPESRSSENSEETTKAVQKLVNPKTEKLNVKGVKLRREGGLIIETATAEDAQKIIENEKLKNEGYQVTKVGANNSKIIIFDCPIGLNEEELTGEIHDRNKELLNNFKDDDSNEDFNYDDFKLEFEPRFKTGKRRVDVTNWVIEVSPKMRNFLRRSDELRLYIGWHSCKIHDFIGVTRCFKCQQYGHVQKICTEKDKVCSYCSKVEHLMEQCPDKLSKKTPTCASCKRSKKKADHMNGDKVCPNYKIFKDRVIARTDYGIQ